MQQVLIGPKIDDRIPALGFAFILTLGRGDPYREKQEAISVSFRCTT